MGNEFNIIGLYDHNADSYRKVRAAYNSGEKVVGIVHATGTGKTYNALQLAYDNKDKKILYVVPSNGIIEHIKKVIENNPNLDIKRDFPNLQFITYQALSSMEDYELKELDVDLLILDEFHHIGAPVWGSKVNTLIETHDDLKVFGMTAYTVRDRGTSYERDMSNPETDELFSNKIVSRYDLVDAWLDGVLPIPNYKTTHLNLLNLVNELEVRAKSMNASSPDYLKIMALINDVKKRIAEAPGVETIIKNNVKPNGKYIYFCPPGAEVNKNDIESIKKEALEWFKQIVPESDIVFYTSTSDMGLDGKKNREAFYNDETLDGDPADGKLRVMFAINQYNEGIHAPNIDGVIMGRGTQSDIIFFEQLGRALSVRGNTKEKIDEYIEYPLEYLMSLCIEKKLINIEKLKKDLLKEEYELYKDKALEELISLNKIDENTIKMILIERLISPVVIDLSDNISFIKELENNLKDRIKLLQTNRLGNERNIYISDAVFSASIEEYNEDLFNTLMDLRERLNVGFEKKVIEYFEIIEREGKIPSKNDKRTFIDGTKIKTFWGNNKEKIYEEISKEENRINYSKAYEVIYNRYHNLEDKLKIIEYFEIIESERRIPLSTDKRTFKVDETIIGNFWDKKKEEIYEEICKEENKNQYPIAYRLIYNRYYNLEDKYKLIEYFEIIEREGEIPSITDKRTFIDGTKIAQFWNTYNNKEKIYEAISEEVNKTKYPKAYRLIYNRYHNLNEKLKLIEYFEIIESESKMPSTTDEKTFKTDGTKIKKFWEHHKEKIYEEICKEENKIKYPKAYELIRKRYLGIAKDEQEEIKHLRIIEYFEIIEKDGKIPSNDDERIFKINETKIGPFWGNNKEEIYEEICKEENRIKYLIAYELITKRYLGIDKDEQEEKEYLKIIEYFEIIEKEERIPSQYDKRTFKIDGKQISRFWSTYNNKEKIYEEICKEENKTKYPKAYELITKRYLGIDKDENEEKDHLRLIEYFEIIESEGKIPTQRDKRTFIDGTKIAQFWSTYNNKEKIYEEICKEETKIKYPKAYELIRKRYLGIDKDEQEEIKHLRIIEYFEIIEKDGKIPSDDDERIFKINETKIGPFWGNNKENIYEEINKEENRTKYPKAYELITKRYKEYYAKKQQKLIKEICLEKGINIELNKVVIKHLIYEEFVAKLQLLEELEISLVNETGTLHEIFSMSSLNMKAKYGFTIEELLDLYKGKGLK